MKGEEVNMKALAPRADESRRAAIEAVLLRIVNGLNSQNSIRAYKTAWINFTKFCADNNTNPLDATPLDIENWIAYMKRQELASATRSLRLSAVKVFYAALHRGGLIQQNPVRDAKILGSGKTANTPWLYEHELKALLQALPEQTWIANRDRTALYVLVGTGIRRDSLSQLNVEDIDRTNGTMRARMKGGRVLTFALPKRIREALEIWIDGAPGVGLGRMKKGPLFPQFAFAKADRRLSVGGIWRIVQRAGAKAGIPRERLTVHAIRRSYATLLYKQGTPLEKIQAFLGHTSSDMTLRYVKLSLTSHGRAPGEDLLDTILGRVKEKEE